MNRSIISLELNELCPPLLDLWMGEGLLPNFSRLHAQSQVFTTYPDTEKADELEPWIQWYSIHTGLPFADHDVFHLTDGRDAKDVDIWQFLLAQGKSVMNFSSMNAAPFAAPGSLYLADPWCHDGRSYPPELNRFADFVAHNVREHSNQDGQLDVSSYAAFIGFMITHGWSPDTIMRTLSQLVAEKSDPARNAQRVAILDAMQYDVFAHYSRKLAPDFASFFVNSVAHLQHSYWRHMDPDTFTVRPAPAELDKYGSAIREGYIAMDHLIGRFLRLAEKQDALIIFQTALSQQPFLRYEDQGSQHFYRLRDLQALLDGCGLSPSHAEPTMTHQYMLHFADRAERDTARARLEGWETEAGDQVFGFSKHDREENALYFGCQLRTVMDDDAIIHDRSTGRSHKFSDWLYAMEATKSGCHHPDGCLWIATGDHAVHDDKVSILDIWPTIVELSGVQDRSSERPGKSLIPRFILEESRRAA
ncbi:hypothetical protein [Parasphingorhabdus sp.]|uniref:hypothetical protein n=1 Tax=Parasphingorhabdus sp. TaxID=2709688 RepID=UPI003A93BCFB